MDFFLLLLFVAPLMVGVLACFRAIRREDPFSAFAFGLGATWVGVIGVSVVIGIASDAWTLHAVESPKYYATPFMALAAVALGLVLGLAAGACAGLVVRARVREQTQSVLREEERATAADGQRYSSYFPGKDVGRPDV